MSREKKVFNVPKDAAEAFARIANQAAFGCVDAAIRAMETFTAEEMKAWQEDVLGIRSESWAKN